MKTFEGKIDASDKKIAIVLSKFNSFIGDKLVLGAKDAYRQMNGDEADLVLYKVPGALEIPGVVKKLKDQKVFDGIICLGTIIRGATPHFEYVAGNTTKALMNLAEEGNIPVINAILTTNTIEQAMDRAGIKSGNKGYDGMLGLLEMINLYDQIED